MVFQFDVFLVNSVTTDLADSVQKDIRSICFMIDLAELVVEGHPVLPFYDHPSELVDVQWQ